MPESFSHESLPSRLKSQVALTLRGSGSAKLTEAVARGLGFASHAALGAAGTGGVPATPPPGFALRAASRLAELMPGACPDIAAEAFAEAETGAAPWPPGARPAPRGGELVGTGPRPPSHLLLAMLRQLSAEAPGGRCPDAEHFARRVREGGFVGEEVVLASPALAGRILRFLPGAGVRARPFPYPMSHGEILFGAAFPGKDRIHFTKDGNAAWLPWYHPVPSLGQLRDRNLVSAGAEAVLRGHAAGRDRVMVIGYTGSGKTTLVNCLAEAVPWSRPLVLLEDPAEIHLAATRPALRWERAMDSGDADFPPDGDVPISARLVMGEVSSHARAWAMRAARRAAGALLAAHPNTTRNREEGSTAELVTRQFAAHCADGGTPFDAVVCMGRSGAVESCWNVRPGAVLIRTA